MKFTNLEKLRNHSGKTLEEVANILNVSKTTISNWEKNPDNVPMSKLSEYANAINYSIDDIFEKKNTNTKTLLNVVENEELTILRKNLRSNIDILSNNLKNNYNDLILSNNNIFSTILKNMKNLQVGSRKPRVALVGESDTGKSTLINHFLGQGDLLPAKWTPATGSVIKIAHIDDKPNWLIGNTIVLKNDKHSIVDETWDLLDSKYDNVDYFQKHVIQQGERDLIASFGDRSGNNYQHSLGDVYTIYTFVDAIILKSIEIWDTPGIGAGDDNEGESDEILSIYAQTNADMIIYLSVVNQFMHSSDVAYLRQAVKRIDKSSDFKNNLPAWNNLMIVASQAHIVKSNYEIENILNKGSERLLHQFGQDFLNKDNGYDELAFRNRFFSFSKEDESIRHKFENDLNDIFKNKSQLIFSEASSKQKKFNLQSSELLINEINENKKLLNEDQSLRKELIAASDNLNSVLQANSLIEKKLKKASKKGRNESELGFRKYYSKNLTESELLKHIDSQDVKNKKGSKEDFNTWLSGNFQDKLESILKNESEKFKEQFNEIGEDIQKTSDINVSSFDFTSVMAGLVTSGIVGGAFAIVAAGITSNLGLYILVAQVGGLLTSIGVISSPIVLTSLVAATGGPIGWAIGLAILSGTFVSWILGSSAWKGKLAKQIIKAYEKNNALNQFINAIDDYWDKTDISIEKLKESMDLVANEQVNILEKKVTSNPVELELALEQLSKVADILIAHK